MAKTTKEFRITGFPGCDSFHPKNGREAKDIVREQKRNMTDAAGVYAATGDHRMAAEMRRRVENTGYESRTVTEWEEAK